MNFPPELLLKAQGVRLVFFDLRDMLTDAGGGFDASPDSFRLGRQDWLGLEMLQKTGIEPTPEELTPVILGAYPQMASYLREQRDKGDWLWQGVKFEDINREQNFIRRADGKYVWVDPLYHQDLTDPFGR